MITGFTHSFAQRIPNGDIPNGERREYLKPMLFSGGVGQLDDRHLHKGQPEKDMLVKVDGPAYRIGLGGGAAWSQVETVVELEFEAVQCGDAEMENKMIRVIRHTNPIVSIHEQGAGGNGTC